MLPCFPVISFGPELPDFELVRRQEPVLFLSILAAAAGNMTSDDTYEKLQTEAISVITYQSIVKGQKRSELIIALIVVTCWPMAPTRYQSPLAVCLIQVRSIERICADAYDFGHGHRSWTTEARQGSAPKSIQQAPP
jgi:hypothetical protein